jgi:hypothetical protein
MADFLSPMENVTSQTTGPGDAALAVAKRQLGKPYVYGAHGPGAFDCSGLMNYSYLNGPHIDVGWTTDTEWGNNTTLTTAYDALKQSGLTAGDLVVGDLLLYFQPGNSGQNAHVKMYAGGGQTIEAPHSGDVVKMAQVDLIGDASEPFRGVKRVTGASGSATISPGSGSGSGSGNSSSTNTGLNPQQMADLKKNIEALKDPRNNLPFSALFQGQNVPSVKGSGSMRVAPFGSAPEFAPITHLVRGGIGELVAKQFKCYFMMNPLEIDMNLQIDQAHLNPFQMQSNEMFQSGGYMAQNQTINFTIYFNRMYEVWQGNIPGPSDEGTRWDIRALERLYGLFDASVKGGGATGLGSNGWGGYAASMLPVQVVFGAGNSIQFQGFMTSLNYAFTLFSSDMIPVEAWAQIQVMRVWNPSESGADLVSQLITTSGQGGPQKLPNGKPFTK